MLTRFDRIQVVVPDRSAAADAFARLLGAERVGEDRLAALAARRSVLRSGTSEVDLLEPDGAGEVARFAAEGRGGLFAVGFAAPDPAAAAARLAARGIRCANDAGLWFVDPGALGVPGLRLVIGPEAQRPAAGLLRYLFEATLLVPDWKRASERFGSALELDADRFVGIQSAEYGYEGTLTLLEEGRLDRLELVTPRDPGKTMGRFFQRRGAGLYMAYAESDDPAAVRERLLEHAPEHWTGPRGAGRVDNLFVHPGALGLLLGISRTSVAWTWSGHPERVQGRGE